MTRKRKSTPKKQAGPKFVQIAIGQWAARDSGSHTVYGLTSTGKVYKFWKTEGWMPVEYVADMAGESFYD